MKTQLDFDEEATEANDFLQNKHLQRCKMSFEKLRTLHSDYIIQTASWLLSIAIKKTHTIQISCGH